MAANGADVVGQLRGRMKFYHVGDPVRRDMKEACDTINELLAVQLEGGLRGTTHTAAYEELNEELERLKRENQELKERIANSVVTVIEPTSAQVVSAYLDDNDIKLLPWQRKRLALGSET